MCATRVPLSLFLEAVWLAKLARSSAAGPAFGWSASTPAVIPRPENASTSANPSRAGYAPRRPTSTVCLRSATLAGTSAPPGRPSASISIIGSKLALNRGCEPRASATTVACLHGTFVQGWAEDRLGSSRRRRSRELLGLSSQYESCSDRVGLIEGECVGTSGVGHPLDLGDDEPRC